MEFVFPDLVLQTASALQNAARLLWEELSLEGAVADCMGGH